MKRIKLASLFLFGMMAFVCGKSLAQSQNNQSQQTPTQTDPNAGTTTQENPDTTQPQSTDPNASTQPNNVTIDSTSTGTSTDYGSTSTGTTGTTRSEPTTKIHIYSGKHDGNNVINPDPKN